MMLKAFAPLALALSLTACATGPRDRYERLLTPKANPSAVIATELAFARAAREEGQWAAFRDYAADDAVLFVPQAVDAQEWLDGRESPPSAASWTPHQVWSSCDGSLAVTKGAWREPGGSTGYFNTVWRREGKGENAEYRWVLHQEAPLAEPLAQPDFIGTDIASCEPLPPISAITDNAGGRTYRFASDDRSLNAAVRVDPWCGRIVTVSMFRGNPAVGDSPGVERGSVQVLYEQIAPPSAADGGAPERNCAAP